MSTKHLIYLLFLMLGTSRLGVAQSSGGDISEAVVDSLAASYVYDDVETRWRMKDLSFGDSFLRGPRFDLGLSTILKALFYIVGFAVIVAVLVYAFILYRRNQRNEKIASADTFDLDKIENIQTVDFNALLVEALRNADYRLAFRVRFLQVLQKLAKTNALDYQPYKTNRVYTRELDSSRFQSPFRQLASVFEQVWYGQEQLDESGYNQLQRYILQFDIDSGVHAA